MAINVGVIGLGNMGKHHARIYHQLPESHLVCISDHNEDVAQVRI